MPRTKIARTLTALTCITATAALIAPAMSGATTRGDAGALIGSWKRTLSQADLDRTASFRVEPAGSTPPPIGPVTLAIAKGSFTFRDESGFAISQTTHVDGAGGFGIVSYVAPDKGSFCTADEPQNATYTWRLDGASLLLTATDDRCADRNSILVGRWARSSTDRTLIGHSTGQTNGKTRFTFTDRLTEAGKPVGTDAGACIIAASHKSAACVITLALRDGKLTLRGSMTLAAPTDHFTIAKGAGAYAGAHGSVSTTTHGKDTTIKVHLA
jgi:hypothetical protein